MSKIFDNKIALDKWINEQFPAPKEWRWDMNEPSQEAIAEKLAEEGYDLDNLLADGHDYEINGHTNSGWAYRDEIAPEFVEELEIQGRIRERDSYE